MSLDDLHRVILEIDFIVKAGFFFIFNLLFFIAFYLFIPFFISIFWFFYLLFSLVKLFFKWRKILRFLEINA